MDWIMIAEVGFKAVAGELSGGFDHEAVAGDFGEDGSGGDGGVFGIAFDEGFDGAGGIGGELVAVDEGFLWLCGELSEGLAHGLEGGAEDVKAVYFGGGDDDDAVLGVFGDAEEEGVALFGGEFFGVVETLGVEVLGEEDGGDNEGSGDWSSSGFIDTCGLGVEWEGGGWVDFGTIPGRRALGFGWFGYNEVSSGEYSSVG